MIKKNFSKLLTSLCIGFSLYQGQALGSPIDNYDGFSCSSTCPTANFGVDFLYWKPCVDDLDFAAVISSQNVSDIENTTNLSYKSICPDWNAGIRAYGNFPSFCRGFDLYASYTYVKFDDTATVDADITNRVIIANINPIIFFSPVNNFYESAKDRYEGKYQSFDALLRYPVILSACQTFTPYFGVTGMSFDQKERTVFQTTTPITSLTNRWKSDYFGVGLKIGSEWSYRICDTLSLFANGSGSILTGDSDNSCRQTINIDFGPETTPFGRIFNYKDNSCCQIVPGYHIQTGFSYETFACGCDFSLRVGYEFINWSNIANPRRFDMPTVPVEALVPRQPIQAEVNSAFSDPTNTRDLGFHGLFAGIDLRF